MGNPNWVKGGTFAGAYQFRHRAPDEPDTNAVSEPPVARPLSPRAQLFSGKEPEATQRLPDKPIQTRFFLKSESSSRRRPDINALDAILREHLGISTPSPALDDSGASSNGFFPPLTSLKKDMLRRDLNT